MTRSTAAAVAVALLTTTAVAQNPTLQYEFARSDGQAAASFTAAPGGTVDIRLYLRVLADPGGVVAAGQGFGTAAVRLGIDQPTTATVTGPGSITAGPAWATAAPSADPGEAGLAVAADLFAVAGVSPTSGRVLIGTFRFDALQAGTVVLTAGDLNPGIGSDTSGFGSPFTDYDPYIAPSSAVLTVSPVSEPAAVGAVAVLGLLASRGRRTG